MRAPNPPRVKPPQPSDQDLVLSAQDAQAFEAERGRTTAPARGELSPASTSPSLATERPAVTPLEERRRERVRAYRRVLAIRVGGIFVGIGLIAGLVWLGWFSSLLALDTDSITVEGASGYVDPAQVVEVASVEAGTPLLRLDTSQLAAEIEQIPSIAQVQIARSWPQGITVSVTPRDVVAVAGSTESDTVELVAADGVVVATVPTGEVGDSLPWVAIDMSAQDAGESVSAALSVLGQLSDATADRITEVSASSPQALEFTLDSGARVLWGSAEDTELKDRVLQTLLQVEASEYDVSTPLAPSTR